MPGYHHSGPDALPAREGTLVLVDCIDGLTSQTSEWLHQALAKGIKPFLVLVNFHRCFLELKWDGEKAYRTFCSIIKDVNAIIKLYNTQMLKYVEVHPSDGTVFFFSDSWGLSIQQFAEICESRFGSDQAKMMSRLWGNHFFDPSTKKWTHCRTSSGSCKRGFILYVYDPIKKILNSCIHGQKGRLQLMMQSFGHEEMDLQDLKGEELFEHIMQKWLPISKTLCEDTSSFNPQGLSKELSQLLDSSCTTKKIDGVTASFKKGNEVLGEKTPAYFCLMPKGSIKKQFKLPPEVIERLAPYQIEGVQWLWNLHCESKGGILADDMGMGKTRTVCSFLHGLLRCSLTKRAIVIAPKTILSQWQAELRNVGLADQIHMYRTPQSQGESLNNVIIRGGVLLTTYEVFRSKHKLITREDTETVEWDYLFLDEGHRIKNDKTQTWHAFNTLKCRHKIVITGTPFQNNLKELYVLVDFCCPNLLGTEQEFVDKFVEPIERAKFADSELGYKRLSMSASEGLKELLRPYMLRRTKRLLQAMGLLGNKHEMTVWLQMTKNQINLYKGLLTKVKLGNSEGVAFAEAAVAKNICNHPSILRKADSGDSKIPLEAQGLASNYKKQLLDLISFPDRVTSSCKVRFVMYLVKTLRAQRHKILIFSQSVQMLELLEEALLMFMSECQIIRMDGSTSQPERDKKIKIFQSNIEDPEKFSPEDVPDVFLMTTSVGGMGLNLTAASRVIIIDPAQNPSMDNQSVDRAFRFGQKKDVIVYRLITSGTIEEHTYRQQVLKGEVSTSVTEEQQCARALDKETGKVLSLPLNGFDISLTHKELLESASHTGFDKSMLSDLDLVTTHNLVVGVSNHGSLFSTEEVLPLPCDDESPVYLGRCHRKKFSCDVVIAGEKYAYKVTDERWGIRNSVGKPLPQKFSTHEESGGDVHEQRAPRMNPGEKGAWSGNDPPKGPDAPAGPG